MATVNSATTYYLAASGPTGFEYDLTSRFASQLGLKLDVLVVGDRDQAMRAVDDGRAHLAAGLATTPNRQDRLRFTQSYLTVQPQVVYLSGNRKPRSLADLSGRLTLPAYVATAEWLRENHPEVEFAVDANANSEELMVRVAEGDIAYTIADSNLIKLNQRYYPNLRVGFSLGYEQQLSWAFPRTDSDPLYNKALAFLADQKNSPSLGILRDRYFGHVDRLGFVGGKTFARQVEERLPRFRKAFQQAGKKHALDWRLLAAVGYQESHWDPDAISPTKVRGLMMLTRRTARELGVSNRRDPAQSIAGGAAYIEALHKRMKGMRGKLEEPDRTWMTLAAYNIGMGHLMDTRRLVDAAGGDPDRWVDVRATLPKLTQERFHSRTRYGYARGHEAVTYVGNIRAYHDILLWMTSDRDMKIPEALTRDKNDPLTPQERALQIDTPVL